MAEPMPQIRAAGLLLQGDSVLLVRHQKGEDTYWLLPGGGVQFGESLEEALHRELLEEACLDAQVGPLVLVNDSIAPDGSRHMVQLVFRCEHVVGEPLVGQDPRVVETRYVGIDEMNDLELRPDLRKELVAGIQKRFHRCSGLRRKALVKRNVASANR